jgi:hypothetical protein
MGGHALPLADTRRFEADEYFQTWYQFYQELQAKFPSIRAELIPAYYKKESFGDMDVLYRIPQPWVDNDVGNSAALTVEELKKTFSPKQIVNNSCVISLDYHGIQVDMIYASTSEFDYALAYYSYNDLGNLVGKLARRFGMKHGHDGLWLPIRDGDYHVGDILLTLDVRKTYEFLKLDYDVAQEGFANLDEIFNFVSSSPYYDPELYKLENLNHTAKIRDKKRETYRKFLEFGEKYTGPVEKMNRDKKSYLVQVLNAFGKWTEFETMMKNVVLHRAAREIFNGEIVAQVTGLQGKELGRFMRTLKECREFAPEVVVYLGAERVIANIQCQFNTYRNSGELKY